MRTLTYGFMTSLNSNGVVLGITLAMACEFYGDMMQSRPHSFKDMARKIRSRYPRGREGRPEFCGLTISCISDTAIKKVSLSSQLAGASIS